MKTLKKLSLNHLEGERLPNQKLKSIIGGYSGTGCCGYNCKAVYDYQTGDWLGCAYHPDSNSFCCYG